MKGIDTNILVRFLVGDDHDQAKIVYNLFKEVELNKNELFVPLLVVLELLWVLESAYNIERNNIIDSISDLILMPILKFEHLEAVQKFIIAAKNSKYDLSDLLIAHTASSYGCETVFTFDKKASKYSLFELIK
ncbi:MAG: PIN domain-containing protein [Desulfobacter postgatei]|jgi:predicted nucleic-acid-binding protein|uniref:PIN domain-containing protein n=1 Tax=Desulfobacter postgatei TaxID=2293 RepID=UPI0023F2F1F0|nr:PIN domain-containing protein [Desulfobacter postgatei]MDD4273751.1 PIN domain-containing protein [Desulfobacter postgatei]